MFTSDFAICFMADTRSPVSAKALLKFWIAVSVSAFMCAPSARSSAIRLERAPLLVPDLKAVSVAPCHTSAVQLDGLVRRDHLQATRALRLGRHPNGGKRCRIA